MKNSRHDPLLTDKKGEGGDQKGGRHAPHMPGQPLGRAHVPARSLADDPALALHYGETADLSEVSIVGLIGQSSETMLHAFTQLQRYNRLTTDIDAGPGERFVLSRRGEELWLVDNRRNPSDFLEHTEIAFAQMVSGSRAFGVDPFTTAVRFTHADPGYRGEYERILGAPVTFGCNENAMLLEQRFLTHTIAKQPRYVFGILSERAASLLKNLEDTESMRARIEGLLMPTLHTGEANIEIVAAKLGMSRQDSIPRSQSRRCDLSASAR